MAITLAVVPAAVSRELRGLLTRMEHEAECADPLTDPGFVRARVFTDNFSALMADLVSLLLGYERLVLEAVLAQSGRRAQCEEQTAELGDLAAQLVSYLTHMGLTDTLRYLLTEAGRAGAALTARLLTPYC